MSAEGFKLTESPAYHHVYHLVALPNQQYTEQMPPEVWRFYRYTGRTYKKFGTSTQSI
ncbi:MAG: hypothetical protein L7S59_04710 [Pseudomonadales bacterium]|nr:hypothetical protein [Pseudomonadales bacterium]